MAASSVSAARKRCVSAADLRSSAGLSRWLLDRLPYSSFLSWGKFPGTKTVGNLWLELSQGEVSLEDDIPPKRTVHVVCIKITNGSGKILLEASQEMSDGTVRDRNRPLSEKMKPGEGVKYACLRGIKEELGSDLGSEDSVQMMEHTYRKEVQERESFSYPGLMTCYVLHHMEALMKGLPSEDFVTEENELCASGKDAGSQSRQQALEEDVSSSNQQGSALGVKKHFWKWVPEKSETLG